MIVFPSPHLVTIGNPSPTKNGARDITTELNTALANGDQVYLEGGPGGTEGFYEIQMDQIAITEAMGARAIFGAGGLAIRTTVVCKGSGVGILSEAERSVIAGINFQGGDGAENLISTAIKMTTNRYPVVSDVRGRHLKTAAEFHGASCYYWRLEDSYASKCDYGFYFSADANNYGANRGLAQGNMTYKCAIGYNVQGANTIDFMGCRSAANARGIVLNAERCKFLGGAFEDETVSAIEVGDGCRDNIFRNHNCDKTTPVIDLGVRTVIEPAAEIPWISR